MKARITLTVIMEYEVDGTGPAAQQLLADDIESFKDDPDIFWELTDIKGLKMDWKGELLK